MNLAARVIEVFAEHGMAVDMAMIREALASKRLPEPSKELQEGFTRRRSMNRNAKLYGLPEWYGRTMATSKPRLAKLNNRNR